MKEQLQEILKKYVNRRKGHRATVTTKIRTLEKLLKEVNLDEAKLLAIKGALAEKIEILRELNEKILEKIEETVFDESDDDPVSRKYVIQQSGKIRYLKPVIELIWLLIRCVVIVIVILPQVVRVVDLKEKVTSSYLRCILKNSREILKIGYRGKIRLTQLFIIMKLWKI